ncbi:hypothetical protein IWW39_000306 [Coemansia spiralis]|uniref:Uncharacterized protein n=1 Tax=Coemansia spiralis TaxID=417178 RepID=A0A9W8GNR4_9FUNG|nr:hypothetical protein IWW39_000306 [Coemansia spiralis]
MGDDSPPQPQPQRNSGDGRPDARDQPQRNPGDDHPDTRNEPQRNSGDNHTDSREQPQRSSGDNHPDSREQPQRNSGDDHSDSRVQPQRNSGDNRPDARDQPQPQPKDERKDERNEVHNSGNNNGSNGRQEESRPDGGSQGPRPGSNAPPAHEHFEQVQHPGGNPANVDLLTHDVVNDDRNGVHTNIVQRVSVSGNNVNGQVTNKVVQGGNGVFVNGRGNTIVSPSIRNPSGPSGHRQ